MTWQDFIASLVFVCLMIATLLWASGCSTKDNDLKTSQCSATMSFNCDCQKDSSIITDLGDGVDRVKKQ